MNIDLKSFFDPQLDQMVLDPADPMKKRVSQFAALWRMARLAAGRPIDQALDQVIIAIDNRSEPDTFLGLPFDGGFYISFRHLSVALYLMLLDQLSAIFPTYDPSGVKGNGIERLLRNAAPPLGADKAKAIATLRHTLAHNFSLGSDKGHKKPWFKYTLIHGTNPTIGKSADPVVLPITEFDGIYQVEDPAMQTTVYVHSLIDLVESVISNLITAQSTSGYSDILDPAELQVRFTTVE